jgi:hypothetical protein
MSEEIIIEIEEIENADSNPKRLEEVSASPTPQIYSDGEGPVDSGVRIKLGDIIELVAPESHELHQQTFYITYLDDILIKMTNVATRKLHTLNVAEDGAILDETVEEIHILSRSEEDGYARQNGLITGTWVTIYLGGQFPTIIHGLITELAEDQIEVQTVPDSETIYIDFAYQGIPRNLPIDKIVIREAPQGLDEMVSAAKDRSPIDEFCETQTDTPSEELQYASIEYTDEGESMIQTPENMHLDENVREVLHQKYIRASDIVVIGEPEEIQQIVEIPENKKRYGVDVQTNDLLDELLSTIPNYQRTTDVLENIHHLITRFKQLRTLFSTYDEYGEIKSAKILGAGYKPLVEKIRDLSIRLRWIMPVVGLRRKIYGEGPTEDVPDIVSLNEADELKAQETIMQQYLDKHVIGDTVKYTETYREIGKRMAPFVDPLNSADCLTTKETQVEIEGIIDNLEDFFSTAWSEATNIHRQQFVIQRYNLAMNKLEKDETAAMERRGKAVYVRKPIAPADELCIKSILTLPEPVLRYSQLDLPATDIGVRASLSQTPFYLFRLLRKNAISTEVVNRVDRELNYEDARFAKEGADNSISFLKTVKQYELSDDVIAEEGEEAYEKLLNTILPTTRIFIQMIRKYITDKLSVIEVVKALQPFAIYSKDISYKQHDEIRYFIKERIREFVKQFAEKKEEFSTILNAHYKVQEVEDIVRVLLSPETQSFFRQYYSIEIPSTEYSNHELISQIYAADSATLFAHLIDIESVLMKTPAGFLDVLETEIDDLGEVPKIRPESCARRYLAKRYSSVADLQKDNAEEDVFFDKEFDETPYSLLKNYEKDRKKMSPELFVSFLAENLEKRHGCSPEQKMELAKTLIRGKKRVEDGEYAILDVKSRLPRESDDAEGSRVLQGADSTESRYYRRRNRHWVHDTSVTEENFLDDSTLFCNLDKKCVKNIPLGTCDSVKDTHARMKEIARKTLHDEFSSRFDQSQEDMKDKMTQLVEKAADRMAKSRRLTAVETLRFSLKQYSLGKYAIKTDSEIVSPYETVRDLIFAQSDFAKRQTDIYEFVGRLCRKPIPEKEADHWFYCKETNVKLVPLAIFELAQGFVAGKYAAVLDEVCRKYGEISDDGDSIVDRNSGYVLRKIEYSEEEGYDDAGFKITTHDIIEKDAAAVLLEGIAQKKRVFENQRSELVYGVLQFLSTKVGVSTEELEPAVFPISVELLDKLVKSEDKYRVFAERAKKEGKIVPPYSTYYHQNLIFIVSAAFFVAIQTAIPSFKTSKIVPGCVKSFGGYPATGIEDIAGIQFMACILHKSKSSISPWDAISSFTTTKLARGIKDMIERNIIVRDDIAKRYAAKSEYLELFPEIAVPDEHALQKWRHFLPPVVPFKIRDHLHNVAAHLKSEMLEHMKHGKKAQHENIQVYKSKALLHGYAIIEAINAVVSEKDTILKTSAKMPFLENACCNEAGANPIRYFIQQEDDSKTIEKYIAATKGIERNLEDVRALSTAGILYHTVNTNLVSADLPLGKYDVNIYGAFIHYCHLDTNAPIPDDLESVMSEKPAHYPQSASLEEKIEFFKRNGRAYTGNHLEDLMKVVHLRNRVELYKARPLLQMPVLKAFLEHLERVASREDASPMVEIPLISKLDKLVESYHPYEMYHEPTEALTALNNYLKKSCKMMVTEILGFLEQYSGESLNEIRKIDDFLETVAEWEFVPTGDHDDGLKQATTYIQNAVFHMVKEWPSMILKPTNTKFVPKHWEFSQLHARDLYQMLKQYYSPFDSFKSDATISLLLKEMQTKVDLYTFLQTIPIFTPIQKSGLSYSSFLDKDTLLTLYQYVYYSVFYEYVRAANDNELLYTDINQKRQTQRLRNAELANASNSIRGGDLMIVFEEEEDEADLAEVDIEIGNQDELRARVSKLLVAFIQVQMKEKAITNMSYEKIYTKMRNSRDQEKKSITDFFKRMETDERRMENMKKILKLGRWNVGMQKGLVQYDDDTYERERAEIMAQATGLGGTDLNIFAPEVQEVQEAQDLEDLERAHRDLMEGDETEGFNLGMLPEEYGDNYDETEVDGEDAW